MKPEKNSRLTDSEKARIRALYDDGETLSDIAAALGRPRETVTLYLIRAGEHIRLTNRIDPARLDKALDWYQRGVAVPVIAEVFGIGTDSVYYHVKKRGIAYRQPQKARP